MTDQNTNAWIEAQFADHEADAPPAEPANVRKPDEPARPPASPVGARPPQVQPRPAASVRQSIADLMRGGRPPAPTTAPQQAAEPMERTEPPTASAVAEDAFADTSAGDGTAGAAEPAAEVITEPEGPPVERASEAEPVAPPAPQAGPVAAAEPRTHSGLPDLDRYFPWLRDRKQGEPPAAMVVTEPEPEPQAEPAHRPAPIVIEPSVAHDAVEATVTAAPEPEPAPADAPEPAEATVAPYPAPQPAAKPAGAQPSRTQPRRRPPAPPLAAEEFWALRPEPIDRFVAMGSPRPVEAAQACRDRLDQIARMLGGGAVSPSERAPLGAGPGTRKSGCAIQQTDGGDGGTLRAALEFIGAGGRRPQH